MMARNFFGESEKCHFSTTKIVFKNQSTVSTAKRQASLFSYLIALTNDTLHNTINGYEILHVYVQCKCMYDANKC